MAVLPLCAILSSDLGLLHTVFIVTVLCLENSKLDKDVVK